MRRAHRFAPIVSIAVLMMPFAATAKAAVPLSASPAATAQPVTRLAGSDGPGRPDLIDMHNPGSDPLVVARQDALHPVAEKIRAWASDHDEEFSDLEIDAVADNLTVYRRGGQPAQDLLEQYTKFGGERISLEFAHAILTEKEASELDGLITGDSIKLERSGTPVSAWGIDRVGGAFTVWYTANSPISRVNSLLESAQYGHLASAIKFVKTTAPLAASTRQRTADVSQFIGGAGVRLAAGGGCSSGFGVKSNVNGSTYLITAWHCYKPSDPRIWTFGNTYMGSITSTLPGSDVAFIKTPADNYIFDGVHPNTTSYKNVVGLSQPTAGDYICNTGFTSYLRCNIRVGTGRTWNVRGPASPNPGVTAHGSVVTSTDSAWIVALGDSGGPLFRNTNGNSQALAYGLLSSQYLDGTCPSWIPPGYCGNTGLIGLARDVVLANNVTFTY